MQHHDDDPSARLQHSPKLAERLLRILEDRALPAPVREAAGTILLELRAISAIARAGALRPIAPLLTPSSLRALRDFGPWGVLSCVALQHPPRTAVVDDRGRLSFAELEAQSNAVAHGLRARDLDDRGCVAILCLNHAGTLIALFGAVRAGCDVVFLNAGSAPPQVLDVCMRERVRAILVDDDLRGLTSELPADVQQIACWRGGEVPLEELQRGSPRTLPKRPRRLGSVVMLTSGTTGTPKGALRGPTRSYAVGGGLLQRIPFRAGESTVVAAPLFHGAGLISATLNVNLGSTVVLRRRFEPEQCVADLQAQRASGLALVPTMLQRVLALGEQRIRSAGLGDLRIVWCTGSHPSADLAKRATELLGDVLYNLYGSTEVGIATIATPGDLRAAPGTVGRVMLGSRVRILDSSERAVAPGTTGRIFVGSTTPFEGYAGGGSKQQVDGLFFTGDLGHFGANERLFIDGREDEMIISGGENVFPIEIEELLLAHPEVDEAAVIGVADPDFGQRLAAFVVPAHHSELSEDAVREHVRANRARYKVPRDVKFVEELPRNAMGKVLKRELARRVDAQIRRDVRIPET